MVTNNNINAANSGIRFTPVKLPQAEMCPVSPDGFQPSDQALNFLMDCIKSGKLAMTLPTGETVPVKELITKLYESGVLKTNEQGT